VGGAVLSCHGSRPDYARSRGRGDDGAFKPSRNELLSTRPVMGSSADGPLLWLGTRFPNSRPVDATRFCHQVPVATTPALSEYSPHNPRARRHLRRQPRLTPGAQAASAESGCPRWPRVLEKAYCLIGEMMRRQAPTGDADRRRACKRSSCSGGGRRPPGWGFRRGPWTGSGQQGSSGR
jgi:hypothetical protein